MEETPPEMAKKLCSNILRVVLILIQKGVSKTKFTLDLHPIQKRGKILRKALNDMMLEHHHILTCIPHDVHMSFVSPSPREYEFSCSGSPAYPPYRRIMSRARYNHLRKHHTRNYKRTAYVVKDDQNRHAAPPGSDAGSTSTRSMVSLGFGWSPLVRQVRITDSPFTLSRDGGDDRDCHVDKEAEKFIEKFHEELRLQRWMSAADQYGYI